MIADLISREFRLFKNTAKAVLPKMSDEEVGRVRRALQHLISTFDQEIASRSLRKGKSA